MTALPAGPRILALVSDRSGPALWRCIWPLKALHALGYPADYIPKDDSRVAGIVENYDAFLLPRMSWQPEHRHIAQAWFDAIHRAGRIVIYETDDDAFTAAETNRRVELDWTDGKSVERLEAERVERVWAMRECDGVTVSTQRLATITRGLTDKPVVVVPNSIDLRWFRAVVRIAVRTVPGLTVGWAGGRRHDRDVEQMAEAWGRIAYRYPAVTFVVQGHQPDVIAQHVPADRIVRIPWLGLEEYPMGMRQVDIGCCAVADTAFNRAKSNIKAMEFAAAGAAVVASPTLYASLIDHGSSGFLATDAGEWEDALSELIERHALRQMMARRLLKTVEKRHSLAVNLHRWPAAWQTIMESAHRPALYVPAGVSG
jgi:glycosyltransferase involved in cell wall biosynthesis